MGVLALVHCLGSGDIRALRLSDVVSRNRLRVGERVIQLAEPVAGALARYLAWRTGQRLPVQVVYFAYSGTLQTQALALVAKKLQSSLAVEGELVEEGLAAHGDEGEDLLLSRCALAIVVAAARR